MTLSILSLCSCINQRELDELTFPETIEINAELISSESPVMGYPLDMFVTDSIIGVLCSMNMKWIHCYDKETGIYLSGDVAYGRGPGELLSCTNMCYDRSSKRLYLFDNVSEKMLGYKISNTSPYIEFEGEVSFADVSGTIFLKMWPISDSLVLANVQCGSMEDSVTRFQMFTMDGILLDTCSDMPALEGDDRYTFLHSSVTMSPDRRRFASATLFGEILEIYDVSHESIERSVENFFAYPALEFREGVLWESEQTVFGFPYICSDENYIYGSMIDGQDINAFNEIAVFDWNGRGVLRVMTDYNDLRMYPDGDYLYCIVSDSSNELFFARYDVCNFSL